MQSYSGKHVDLPFVEYKQVRKFSIFPYKKTGEEEVQANPQVTPCLPFVLFFIFSFSVFHSFMFGLTFFFKVCRRTG